jgi:hypothetical protein
MNSRDRLWATIAIWAAVTIILTSFLVKTADWLSPNETDRDIVVGLVVIVGLVVVAAAIATVAVHRSPGEDKTTKLTR